MSDDGIRRVAVIGTGVIGQSWVSLFLAAGLDVVATDPVGTGDATLRRAVEAHWPTLERLGLRPGASLDRLNVVDSPEAAAADADFVQENAPERIELKRDLYQRLDAAAGPEVLLASSSSTLLISEIQIACSRPGRVVLGHPFNPPHLIPLVEVAGGRLTTPDAVARAMAFYRRIGKRPILLRREIAGHVANRLQAALWREAYHLVAEGVASVADIDTAIAEGPGLRWALLGPFATQHLSGGPGGMRHVLDHLGPPMQHLWDALGTVALTDAMKQQIVEGVDQALAGSAPDELLSRRDALLVELLQAKARVTHRQDFAM